MQMTLSELSTKIETDKLPLDVFSITPLQLNQYKDGEMVAELSANEARLVTTGKLTATGNVLLRVVDRNAESADRLSTLRSERMVALSPRASGLAFDVLAGDSRFEKIEIPGDVLAVTRGHQIIGRAFQFDAINYKLQTKEPVRVIGQGRRIDARGLESDFITKSFKFIGPVKGTEIPPARPVRAPRESSPQKVNRQKRVREK